MSKHAMNKPNANTPTEMRTAADLLERFSEMYDAVDPSMYKWDARTLRHEADVIEESFPEEPEKPQEALFHYTVPQDYHCDNHTPGEVFTVRLTGDVAQFPDWFTVENVDSGDEFSAQMSELELIIP